MANTRIIRTAINLAFEAARIAIGVTAIFGAGAIFGVTKSAQLLASGAKLTASAAPMIHEVLQKAEEKAAAEAEAESEAEVSEEETADENEDSVERG